MILPFYQSTIGKKILVALTGIVLFGFIIVHLIGNLKIFEGPEVINAYSAFLRHETFLLWTVRLVLIASFVSHIILTIQLKARDLASRPIGYALYKNVGASLPSRFMMWSGAFIGFYVLFHLAHLTIGVGQPRFSTTDVYGNMISGFSIWYVSAIYIAAMISLGFHFYHGLWSLFQTLGLNQPALNRYRRYFAVICAFAVSIGYISIPAAVLLGILR